VTDVKELINAKEKVTAFGRSLGLQIGRDYYAFYDSTLVRVWTMNPELKSQFQRFLSDGDFKDAGSILTEEDCHRNRIPYGDRRYGVIIWKAKNGVLVYPDYFHDLGTINKGMHGYDSSEDDMKGFAVVSLADDQVETIKEAHLVDICPTICDSLHINSPKNNEGESLIHSN